MDSQFAGKWSIPEAETAIKAAFILTKKDSLKYSDIKKAIDDIGREISDRTLSRALTRLCEKGEATKESKGRERWYSLIVDPPLETLKEVYRKADAMVIDSSARIGLTGDASEGWTFYGIPKRVKNRVHRRLQNEANDFQERIDCVLEAEFEETVRRVLARAQEKVSLTTLKNAEKALHYLKRMAFDVGAFGKTLVPSLTLLESYAPGSINILEKDFYKGIPGVPDRSLDYIAERLSIPPSSLEKEIERYKKHLVSLDKLLSAFGEKERDRVKEQFGDLLTACTFWCAVVR